MSLDINAVVGALNAPPAPFVPEQHHLRPGYVLLLTGFGADDEHGQLVQRIRETLPLLFDMVTHGSVAGQDQDVSTRLPSGYLWTVWEADTSVWPGRACQCRAAGYGSGGSVSASPLGAKPLCGRYAFGGLF
jgi:hypothetical protein